MNMMLRCLSCVFVFRTLEMIMILLILDSHSERETYDHNAMWKRNVNFTLSYESTSLYYVARL